MNSSSNDIHCQGLVSNQLATKFYRIISGDLKEDLEQSNCPDGRPASFIEGDLKSTNEIHQCSSEKKKPIGNSYFQL